MGASTRHSECSTQKLHGEKELSFSLGRAKVPWTHKVGFVLLLSPLLQSLLLLSLTLQSVATCF